MIILTISCKGGGGASPSSTSSIGPSGSLSISSPSASYVNFSAASTYTVVFSNVSSPTLTSSDITLLKTGTANATYSVTSAGSNTYHVTVQTGTGDGTIGIKINGASNIGLDGNRLAEYTSSAFTLDNTPPILSTNFNSLSISPSNKSVYFRYICQDGLNISTADASKISGIKTGSVNFTAGFDDYGVSLSNITGAGSITNIAVDKSACVDQAGNVSGTGNLNHSFSAITVIPFLKVTDLAMGTYHACALLTGGSVKCWGGNLFGQGILGYGNTVDIGDDSLEMGNNLPTINLGTGRTAKKISAGGTSTCAILDNNDLKCWGSNSSGQLGKGHINILGDSLAEMGDALTKIDLGAGRYPTSIAVGSSHVCAILDNSSLACWGYNASGQLGLGHALNQGDNANEMGANIQMVNLGTGKTASKIFAGGSNTCAILNDGSLKCWGQNTYGQLGQGHLNNLGDNAGEMGDALLPINLGTGLTATDIIIDSVGSICAILNNASVKCWGRNQNGQLGLENSIAIGGNISEMGDNLAAINFGSGKTVTKMSGGREHFCAKLNDGSLTCWGWNSTGGLGLGIGGPNRGDAVGDMGAGLMTVNTGIADDITQIVSGDQINCVLSDSGIIKCWGNNYWGQLGQERGFPSEIGIMPSGMGTNLPETKVNKYDIF